MHATIWRFIDMGIFKGQMWKVLDWEDSTRDTMVYKFPMGGKEIMSGSQLTVRESQVAIFVHLGKLADVFGPGKYKLTTANLPILSGLGSIFYQGESRFKAELYFINTKQFLDQPWGTMQPVTIRDKDFGMVRIKAFGNYSFKVVDATVFMREVFGTTDKYKVSDIANYLQGILVSVMTDTIAESQIAVLDMAANMMEFGDMVKGNAMRKLETLGLQLTDYNIININMPENVEKALDERTSLGILGDKMGTYTQKKAADALGDMAKNPGTAGTFMGIGMAGQMGGTMNGVFGNIANAQDAPSTTAPAKGKFCAECGAQLSATAKFCAECGAKQSAGSGCVHCGADIKAGTKFCPECGGKQ